MSLATELAELQSLRAEKAELKNQLQSIDQTEKTLGIRIKILEEKLEIKWFKQKIQAKSAVVEELKSKMSQLENRLRTGTPAVATGSKSEPEKMMVKPVPSSA